MNRTIQPFLSLHDPTSSARWSSLAAAGVGVLRIDDILTDEVLVHPLALAHKSKQPAPVQAKIDARIGPDRPEEYFLSVVSHRLSEVAARFAPRPVVVQFSDLTSDDYRRLIGGRQCEPPEPRPALGLHGAARYLSDAYRDSFELQCLALRHAREDRGHRNLHVLVPSCRTVLEADKVLSIMASLGLHRRKPGLEIHAVVETPSVLAVIHDFAQRFDGLAIGSGGLTSLLFGLAPENPMVDLGSVWNAPAMHRVLEQLVDDAERAAVPLTLCGPATADLSFVRLAKDIGMKRVSVAPEHFAVVANLWCGPSSLSDHGKGEQPVADARSATHH